MMTKNRGKIPVTKPFLPNKEDYKALIDQIWNRNWLTNNGPLVEKLEEELEAYLEVPYLSFVTNGTIALQMSIRALGLKGEIITTPFSYVATTSSIVWEGCNPVFVDIEPNSLNIDPNLIEGAITEETSGILATHVYGNPCEIDDIQQVADRYGLKVIYDAAHCFGTEYNGQSVYNYGDISTASFHATKLFHTTEGGAIITKDADMNQRVERMRNFGHAGFGSFDGIGINGKNSEFHAAMGICNLKFMSKVLEQRKVQWLRYENEFIEEPVRSIEINPYAKFNYAYYPLIFESEKVTLKVKESLEMAGISPRRYFYPSLSELDYVNNGETNISVDISRRILCLPLYHDLAQKQQYYIINRIQDII